MKETSLSLAKLDTDDFGSIPNKETYKTQLELPSDSDNTNGFILTFKVPSNVGLNLYNFSIKGTQQDFSSGFAEGQIKLLESKIKLKKNDTIILKKNKK